VHIYIYIMVYYFSQFVTSRHMKIPVNLKFKFDSKAIYMYIVLFINGFILFIKVVFHT